MVLYFFNFFVTAKHVESRRGNDPNEEVDQGLVQTSLELFGHSIQQIAPAIVHPSTPLHSPRHDARVQIVCAAMHARHRW
jgi:hypothetical protein